MMNTFTIVKIALTVGLASGSAYGKSVGKYSVSVNASSAYGDRDTGTAIEIGTALSGWNCSSSTSVNYTESRVNARGQEQMVPVSRRSTYGHSLLTRNQSLSMEFTRDLQAKSNETIVYVTETCYPGPSVLDGLESILSDRKKPREDNRMPVTITWACHVKNELPDTVGFTKRVNCDAAKWSSTSPYFSSLEEMLVPLLRDKQIQATFKLHSKEEEFTKDFCGGQSKNRKIIRLTQGVIPRAGEDDFVFHVEIDGGKQSFDIHSSTGILNEEIAYCSANPEVTVKITAMERDLFFNDHYVPRQGSKDTATLTTEAGENVAMLGLTRKKTYLSSRESYNGDIQITLLNGDPSRDSNPRNRYADEGAHW